MYTDDTNDRDVLSGEPNCHEVIDNIDAWYSFIKLGVETPHLTHDSIQNLSIIFPCILMDIHIERWEELLLGALNAAQNLRDDELQTQIWNQLGQIYILDGKARAAQMAFGKVLKRTEAHHEASMNMLEVYIGLLQAQAINPDEAPLKDLIQYVINLLEETDDPVLQGLLSFTLCFTYTYRGDYQLAVEYGKSAFTCWQSAGRIVEMARTAYMVGAAYRVAKQYDEAQEWLECAKISFGKTIFHRQYVLITHEQASLYYEQGQHEQAIQWYNEALKESFALKQDHITAQVRHGLALAQMAVENYAGAKNNLRFALDWWIKEKNYYHQASVCQAIGHLHYCQKNYGCAQSWWKRGMQLCSGLSDVAGCREVIDEINANLAELGDKANGLSCDE